MVLPAASVIGAVSASFKSKELRIGIHHMDMYYLDLDRLVALEVLLSEWCLTRAARRLNISQLSPDLKAIQA